MSVYLNVLNLPVPPSVDSMYRNVPKVGRVCTAKLLAWRKEAGYRVNLSGKAVKGPVRLHITIYPGKGFNPLTSDLVNREKAVTDLLVSCGKIEDDTARFVRSVTVELGPEGDPKRTAWVDVRVYSLEETAGL